MTDAALQALDEVVGDFLETIEIWNPNECDSDNEKVVSQANRERAEISIGV